MGEAFGIQIAEERCTALIPATFTAQEPAEYEVRENVMCRVIHSWIYEYCHMIPMRPINEWFYKKSAGARSYASLMLKFRIHVSLPQFQCN